MDDMKLCPHCNHLNEFFDADCAVCGESLQGAEVVQANSFGAVVPIGAAAQGAIPEVWFYNIELKTGLEDGQKVEIPMAEKSYVVGRSVGNQMVPDIDIKPFTVPFHDGKDVRRGISKQQLVVIRQGNQVGLYLHPEASTTVKLNGEEVLSRDPQGAFELQDGDQLEIGDVLADPTRKAPGVKIRVSVS